MGISIGVTVGMILVACFLGCIIWHRKCYKDQLSKNIQSGISLPIRVNNIDSSTILSEAVIDHGETLASKKNGHSTWWGKHEQDFVSSAFGIPRYSYKYAIFCILYLYIVLVDGLHSWLTFDLIFVCRLSFIKYKMYLFDLLHTWVSFDLDFVHSFSFIKYSMHVFVSFFKN